MEWTDIRLTVAKADADNAEAVATSTLLAGIPASRAFVLAMTFSRSFS